MTPANAAGSVTFTTNTTETCTAAVAAGQSNCTITYASAGARTINASFTGAAGFQNSTCGPLAQTIAPAVAGVVLTSSVNPSFIGQATNLTATVTGIAPTGAVSFISGAVTLGTVNLSGTGNTRTAVLSVSTLPVGSASITAAYAGDASNAATISPTLTQIVQPGATTTTLVLSPAQPAPGTPVTFTATVAVTAPAVGPATGTVTFLDGTTVLGSAPLVNGVAQFTLASAPIGIRSFSARFDGNVSFTGSISAGVIGGSTIAVPTLNQYGFLLLLSIVIGMGLVAVRADTRAN